MQKAFPINLMRYLLAKWFNPNPPGAKALTFHDMSTSSNTGKQATPSRFPVLRVSDGMMRVSDGMKRIAGPRLRPRETVKKLGRLHNRREGKCERHLRRGAPERNRRSRHLARRETVRVSFRVQSNRFPNFSKSLENARSVAKILF